MTHGPLIAVAAAWWGRQIVRFGADGLAYATRDVMAGQTIAVPVRTFERILKNEMIRAGLPEAKRVAIITRAARRAR